VDNPDRVLAGAGAIVATADSVILDRCGAWINFTSHVLAEHSFAGQVCNLS
jgi:hypothetical protein